MRHFVLLTCAVVLGVSMSASAVAVPDFEYLGASQLGNGNYEHSYKLSNIGGAVPIYDVDHSIIYRHGWISVYTPNDDWIYGSGPMDRWVTDSAPVNVGTELLGFRIEAGTPDVVAGTFYLTDVNHEVFYQGTTMFPVPEPTTLALLAVGGLAVMRRRQ